MLRLDSPTAEFFPSAPPATASITLAQLLSHTSGLLWFIRCMGRPDDTLQECAQTILEGDMHFEPGRGFFYAGPPFTVAGAMAERALSRSWAEIFQTLIAEPLGMSNTSYGDRPNPALSEGDVVSTVDDYGRFAQMILDQGLGTGTVLSSPGIGGFVPLVDYGRRMVFLFVTLDDLNRIWPAVTAILQRAREVVDREG